MNRRFRSERFEKPRGRSAILSGRGLCFTHERQSRPWNRFGGQGRARSFGHKKEVPCGTSCERAPSRPVFTYARRVVAVTSYVSTFGVPTITGFSFSRTCGYVEVL